MSEKIKTLLVGIGGYGAGYVMAAMGMDDEIETVRTVDPFAEKSNAFGAVDELPIFDTIDEFFKAGHTAEAAVISSPIHLHREHICSALSHGLHVLCEKPLCASEDEAKEIIACAKGRPDQKVLIGFQWSFSPAILEAKRQILSGVWGRPLLMRVIVRWPRTFGYYARNEWAGKMADKNGIFIGDSVLSNATAHYLHNPLFMLGGGMALSAMPSKVEAECFRAYDIETFDTAFLRLTIPDCDGGETKAVIAVSHCSESSAEPTLEYVFENGSISCSGDDILRGELNGKKLEFGVIGSNLEGYFNKLSWLCKCAREGADPPCAPETAFPELAVANKVLRGAPVKRFDKKSVVECGANDKRLKVEGLDDAMLMCYEKMKLPSELGIYL